MSSASNLSWCTADNEPDECVQFLGHSSNGHKEDLKVSYVVDNEFRSQKKSSNIQNDGRACASVVQIEKNTTITGYCCCCKNTLRIVRRITELYTLKMPWIIVLLSIVQVCVPFECSMAKIYILHSHFLHVRRHSSVCFLFVSLTSDQVIIYFIACNDSIALLIFKPQRKYDLWRFITYHAVHFNLTHLLLNVALQVLVVSFSNETFQNFSNRTVSISLKAHWMETVTLFSLLADSHRFTNRNDWGAYSCVDCLLLGCDFRSNRINAFESNAIHCWILWRSL